MPKDAGMNGMITRLELHFKPSQSILDKGFVTQMHTKCLASFLFSSLSLLSSDRLYNAPDTRDMYRGFRCVLVRP
jgi:hypothetical protein